MPEKRVGLYLTSRRRIHPPVLPVAIPPLKDFIIKMAGRFYNRGGKGLKSRRHRKETQQLTQIIIETRIHPTPGLQRRGLAALRFSINTGIKWNRRRPPQARRLDSA